LQTNELDRAHECQGEALGIFREQGDDIGEGIGVLNLGGIAARQGDRKSAGALFEQSLAIARSIRHQELESECEECLGDLALRSGDPREAEARFVRALRICRDAEDKRGEAIAVWSLGRVDAANGRHEAARAKFADALPAFQSFGMNAEALDCVDDCAALLTATGRADDAVRLHAAAATVRAALALTSRADRSTQERNLETARRALGDAAFATAWSRGSAFTLEEAIEHALASTVSASITA
jgi:tetratricopeptide (TPR) repeat protein